MELSEKSGDNIISITLDEMLPKTQIHNVILKTLHFFVNRIALFNIVRGSSVYVVVKIMNSEVRYLGWNPG